VAETAHGKGSVLHLGCFPGVSYCRPAALQRRAADGDAARASATAFDARWRGFVERLFARERRGQPVRVSAPLVEWTLLDGTTARVLCLINWSGAETTIEVLLRDTTTTALTAAVTPPLQIAGRDGMVTFRQRLGAGDFIVIPK
jgi:hypothetical protein